MTIIERGTFCSVDRDIYERVGETDAKNRRKRPCEVRGTALSPDITEVFKHQVSAKFVRALIAMRQSRHKFFDLQFFADPAWDILLDLTAARLEIRNVSVSSLCIAAHVPVSTALRWIKRMIAVGTLERHADPDDARRHFIVLSQDTAQKMSVVMSQMHAALSGMYSMACLDEVEAL